MSTDAGLALRDAATTIAESNNVTEVRQVERQLGSMRAACEKQRGEFASELVRCSALLVKAQRRLGEMLPEFTGGRGGNRKRAHQITLKDLEISANDSSKWQRLAAIDRDDFDRFVDSETQDRKRVTVAGVLREFEPTEAKATDYGARLQRLVDAWAGSGADPSAIRAALLDAARVIEPDDDDTVREYMEGRTA